MPRLRRLSGKEVVRILQDLGFEVIRVRGSQYILRRTVVIGSGASAHEATQTVNVPVHGGDVLGIGLLKRLYRDLSRYMSEDELRDHFYVG
jgi:predicted RNA binding protein YcfA (HicA-like mRNA interferase family)